MTYVPFHRRVLACVALAAACCFDVPAGAPPPATDILERAEKIRSPELDYAVNFRLDVTNPNSSWKKRAARYTMIAHGKDHSLVMMREPKQFYPGVLLIANSRYWLLLPRSDKPFQLSPRHVLNGDIAYGDLARGNLLTYYDARVDGEETVDGKDCWRLELKRNRNLALYPRIVCWVAKKSGRHLRFRYYGETGALLKTARYLDYRQGELGLRSMRIEVDNHVRPGERTVLTFENLRTFDTGGLRFERDAMADFRNAAKSRFEADGVQVEPEEIRSLVVAGASAGP